MGLRATRKRFGACEQQGSDLWACELLGSDLWACELLRSDLRGLRATVSAYEWLGSDLEVLRATRKPQKPACAGLRVAGLRSCWLGPPLKPFGSSLQALLSPRDCLSSGPHVAESTGLRSAEF